MTQHIDLFDDDYSGPVLTDTIVVMRDGSADTFSQAFAQDWFELGEELERYEVVVPDTGDYAARLGRMIAAARSAAFGLTVPEASELLRMTSDQYVRRLLRDGEIAGWRDPAGGAASPWMVSESSIGEYLERVRIGRPPRVYEIDAEGDWRLYWGPGPLPHDAEALGTVRRLDDGSTGALILHPLGNYSQGNAGVLRRLNDSDVRRSLR